MKIYNFEQGTPEWLQIRTGRITASRFKDVLSKGVGSAPSKTRQSYIYEVASEILSGCPSESYTNAAMEYGTLSEPAARQVYEEMEMIPVEQVGFVELNEFVGCSPDGLVGKTGLLEIKCPKTSTQIQRVLAGVFPSEYQAQVQGQLWVCEREWCDFVSYDARIKGPAAYFKVRVQRDDKFIKNLEVGVDSFINELKEVLEKLNANGRTDKFELVGAA
jgi:putative phage-type endonuclease